MLTAEQGLKRFRPGGKEEIDRYKNKVDGNWRPDLGGRYLWRAQEKSVIILMDRRFCSFRRC